MRGKKSSNPRFQRALIPELEGLFTRANYTEVIRLYHQHRESFAGLSGTPVICPFGKKF